MWKLILESPFLHRRELVVITISLGVFITVLLFSNQLINFGSVFFVKKVALQVEEGIQQELKDIAKQREEIIASEVLIGPLKRHNLLELLTIAQAEAKKRNLNFVVITDKEGFVLARSHLPAQIGDNFLLTSAYGRIIVKDETKVVTTIERGPRVPLIFVSSSQVFDQGVPIGGITIGYSLYDSYATYFKEKYLQPDAQVVFYTNKEGIVGDSFKNKDQTQLISTYFSLGSDLVEQNLTGLSKEVKIGNKYYVIYHTIFPGIEKSPGGAFVFIPIYHRLYSLFLAIGITLLFFLLYLITIFVLKFLEHHKHRMPILLLVGCLLFTITYFVTVIKLDNSATELKKSPYLIYNSILKFDPESDAITESLEKTLAIKIFTGGEKINAVSFVIKYDPKAVEILDILTSNSFCNPAFFLEKEINKEKGEIKIACGVPNPGFSDLVGVVAELLIQPLGLKPISFQFESGAQVLANDGLGTNVLRTVINGYYQVVRQEFATADIENPLTIFSLSHPNSNRWYNSKKIALSWPKLAGGTYYYNLNQYSDISKEDKVLATTSSNLDLSTSGGVYYFHIYVKDAKGKQGPISNFKIMVDGTPPLPPKIKVSSTKIKKGEVVRLDFTSEDTLSGLQSGFYVKINEGILLPVNPPFYIPFLDSGDYLITVRVFDKANNFSDSSTVIHVDD